MPRTYIHCTVQQQKARIYCMSYNSDHRSLSVHASAYKRRICLDVTEHCHTRDGDHLLQPACRIAMVLYSKLTNCLPLQTHTLAYAGTGSPALSFCLPCFFSFCCFPFLLGAASFMIAVGGAVGGAGDVCSVLVLLVSVPVAAVLLSTLLRGGVGVC